MINKKIPSNFTKSRPPYEADVTSEFLEQFAIIILIWNTTKAHQHTLPKVKICKKYYHSNKNNLSQIEYHLILNYFPDFGI
jgi:hypothetical protein